MEASNAVFLKDVLMKEVTDLRPKRTRIETQE